MKEKFFGLNAKVLVPVDHFTSLFKYHEVRFGENDVNRWTCHDVKSLAGQMFHYPEVRSVCVFDELGKVWLYLLKDATGKCIKREVA